MIGVARVIRHVGFEDLGTFEEPLRAACYFIHYHEAGRDSLAAIDPLGDDLLVLLGGPVCAYEVDANPFLAEEIALLRGRLALSRPTLGVYLGAQLMAAALGARVAPAGVKVISFSPIDLTPVGAAGPLRRLEGVAVLHWHGDAFAIPDGAEGLATTPACATQGFARGPNVLGLQFHPKFDASAGIDPRGLRTEAARRGAALRGPARAMLTEWLAELR